MNNFLLREGRECHEYYGTNGSYGLSEKIPWVPTNSSYNSHSIAQNGRVPPRSLLTPDHSKVQTRILSFKQRRTLLSLSNVVGEFRFLHVWARLLSLTFSTILLLWCFASIMSIDENLSNAYVFVFGVIMAAIVYWFDFGNSIISYLARNQMSADWLISLKTKAFFLFLVSLLGSIPIYITMGNIYFHNGFIEGILMSFHIVPALIYYIAYLRGEDSIILDCSIV